MICRYLNTVAFACGLLLAGCSSGTSFPDGPSTDTSSTVAPTEQEPTVKSLKDAVAEIEELRNKIRDGFAKGDVDAAHGPLHDVGSRLLEFSKLTEDSGLSPEDQKTAQDCADTLFTAFGEVDKTLHGQEGSTYEEEAATIDEAMAVLVESCNSADDTSGL